MQTGPKGRAFILPENASKDDKLAGAVNSMRQVGLIPSSWAKSEIKMRRFFRDDLYRQALMNSRF